MALEVALLLASEHRLEAAFALAREVPHASLFLMHTGAKALGDARLKALHDDGVEVTVCAMDAEAHGFAPREGGPRFGSQYDHAVLVREARRFVALTPRAVVDSRPGDGPRTVRVRIGCDPRLPDAQHALRTAVGYAALDLDVRIAVDAEAEALLDEQHPPRELVRALTTLRVLGRPIVRTADCPPAAVEVRW